MDRILEGIFKYRAANFEKLVAYGFTRTDGCFVYRTFMQNGQMRLTVSVNGAGEISAGVSDPETEEPLLYFWWKTPKASLSAA